MIKWNPASNLPSPSQQKQGLLLRLEDGTVVNGYRPGYISNRDQRDLGYRVISANPVTGEPEDQVAYVKEWAHA